MAIKIKRVALWRAEVVNQPGALAMALDPLAFTDLRVVVGYHFYGEPGKAVVDIAPVVGKKAIEAARSAGFSALPSPTLLIEGDNRAGIGRAIAQALGDAGINIDTLMAQAVGKKYQAVFGFESELEAKKAATLIKKAVAKASKPAARSKAKKK
jgi:hypothetical protein